jgi:hypothetical protein
VLAPRTAATSDGTHPTGHQPAETALTTSWNTIPPLWDTSFKTNETGYLTSSIFCDRTSVPRENETAYLTRVILCARACAPCLISAK